MIPAPRTTTRIFRRSSEGFPPTHSHRAIPTAAFPALPAGARHAHWRSSGPGSNRATVKPIGSADRNPPRTGGTGAHRESRSPAHPTRCLHRFIRRLFENSSKASPLWGSTGRNQQRSGHSISDVWLRRRSSRSDAPLRTSPLSHRPKFGCCKLTTYQVACYTPSGGDFVGVGDRPPEREIVGCLNRNPMSRRAVLLTSTKSSSYPQCRPNGRQGLQTLLASN